MKIEEEIRDEIMHLNEAQQREVLAFARMLRRKDICGATAEKEVAFSKNVEHPEPST